MNQTEEIVSGVIKYLRASGQLDLLPEIIQKLQAQVDILKGENVAIISSPKALSKIQLTQLANQLTDLFKRKLSVVNKVDPYLLGGYVIQVSDKIIDLSINNYLAQIKEELKDDQN